MQTLSGFHFVKARFCAFTTEKRLKYLITTKGKKQEKNDGIQLRIDNLFQFSCLFKAFHLQKNPRVNVRKALHCILFSFIINLFNRHPIFVQMKEDAHVDRY